MHEQAAVLNDVIGDADVNRPVEQEARSRLRTCGSQWYCV
jgi:hypothetical protein